VGDFWEQLGALGFFLRGFVVGDFWEHSEHSDFFEGDFVVGGFFFWGGGGGILDCKCWKKLKND
ncbi:MAG: hypothetical protein SOW33_10170, partial [Sodaliphilus sp.]|nr:hypothetical protein [Sodaliphilus sp.]